MAITPTIISGDALTHSAAGSQGILQNRRKIDMRDRIFLLEPSATPLTLLLNKMGRGVAKSPRHEWLEAAATPTVDTLTDTFTAAETTITPANPNYFPVNSVFRHQATGEVALVTANNGTTMAVTRGYGGTAAAQWASGSSVTILGGAALEGTSAESSRMTQKVRMYNFTQIFRDPFGGSATLQASDLYGPSYLEQEAMERGIEHAKYIELALWFGERNANASLVGTWDDETSPRRTLGGIDEFITTIEADFGSSPGLAEVYDFAGDVFRYGSDVRFWFVSMAEAGAIANLATSALRVVPSEKSFGINITRVITPHGVFNVIAHKLFEGDTYGMRGYALDMQYLEYVYLNGRDTTLYTNIQNNDVDGQKNEYLTECTLLRQFEEAHGRSIDLAEQS